MSLDEMRKKVIFHNSVDVWISACNEKGAEWDDPAAYRKFIGHLLGCNLGLKAFNLCSHEAGATEERKARFAERLAESRDDPNSRNYTIRLSDHAIRSIRDYVIAS